MIFTQAMAILQQRFHSEYKLSSTIRHRGERGRQREDGLLRFLRETLPSAYGVATGEIIPHRGADASPQCDIIIYDRLHMPILGSDKAVQQIPLEAVYAVIECKSRINSPALKDARAKFAAIRRLPRVRSERRLRKGADRGPHFYLFGYQLDSSTEACRELARTAVDQDVSVCSLDKGFTIWISHDDNQETCVWLNATDQAAGHYETLTYFYVLLLEDLRHTDLGSPSYMKLFLSAE